jgi:hypothetical protein
MTDRVRTIVFCAKDFRRIIYWTATLTITFELAAGGVWDIVHVPFVHGLVVENLGYPAYFLTIIGLWQVPGAVALLVRRFPRLTEWAHAGAFFTYSGTVASRPAVGMAWTSGGARPSSPASKGAGLFGASLERTRVLGSHLEGTNLMGVEGLTLERLIEAHTNLWPRLDPPLRAALDAWKAANKPTDGDGAAPL